MKFARSLFLILSTFVFHWVLAQAPLDSDRAATYLLQQAKIVQLAQDFDATNGDYTQFLEMIDNELNGMFEKALQEDNSTIGRFGFATAVNSLHQLGRDAEVEIQQNPAALRAYQRLFLTCQNLSDCLNLLEQDSSMVSPLPNTLGRQLKKLSSQLPTEPWCQKGSGCLLLTAKILSLQLLARIDAAAISNKQEFRSVTPRLQNSDKLEAKALVDRLSSVGQSLHELGSDKLFAELSNQFQSEGMEPATAQLEAIKTVSSLESNDRFTEALKLYLERLQTPDLTAWFQQLFKRAESGDLDKKIVATMFAIFSGKEIYTPQAKIWMEQFKRTMGWSAEVPTEPPRAAKLVRPPTWDSQIRDLIPALSELQKTNEMDLTNSLKHYGFFNGHQTDRGDSLGEILLTNEVAILQRYPSFKSIAFRLSRLKLSVSRMADSSIKLQQAVSSKANKTLGGFATPAFQQATNEMKSAHDAAIADWLELACYAFDFNQANSHLAISTRLKIPFSDQSIDLEAACQHGKTPETEYPRRAVQEYVTGLRAWEDGRPARTEWILNVVSVPIAVVSAIASGGIAAGAGVVAKRLVFRLIVRHFEKQYLLKKSLAFAAYRVGMTVAGAFTFTVVSRTLMVASTGGLHAAGLLDSHMTCYDPKLSFWQNYGKDLVFGSVIFFFLPYSSVAAEGLYKQLSTRGWLGSSPHSLAAGKLAIGLTEGTALFTALPYFTRTVEKLIGDSPDPIWRGSHDFTLNLTNSIAVTLAFKWAFGEIRFRSLGF
ncbi:MAG: hypothetical protein C5B49_14905 [Bdellovibrio sp.]|nr:MAG: hypothetical protein C5B49_14905 [Bdellovibrio sp.]